MSVVLLFSLSETRFLRNRLTGYWIWFFVIELELLANYVQDHC